MEQTDQTASKNITTNFRNCAYSLVLNYLGPFDVVDISPIPNPKHIESVQLFAKRNIPKYYLCTHKEPKACYRDGLEPIRQFPWDISRVRGIFDPYPGMSGQSGSSGILLVDLSDIVINIESILREDNLANSHYFKKLIGNITNYALNKCSNCGFFYKKQTYCTSHFKNQD